MAAPQFPWVSPEEFLDLEERSETKHMYYAGEITAMSGGSGPHAALAANLARHLGNALEDRGCVVFGSDLLLQTGSKSVFVYPDVMVVCGTVVWMDGRPNVVTNPIFVAEVLSPSTEATDRGVKSHEYRGTPSLKQYALIAQSRPFIELHTRHEDGTWRITEVSGLDVECEFESLGCRVPMEKLYRRVFDL